MLTKEILFRQRPLRSVTFIQSGTLISCGACLGGVRREHWSPWPISGLLGRMQLSLWGGGVFAFSDERTGDGVRPHVSARAPVPPSWVLALSGLCQAGRKAEDDMARTRALAHGPRPAAGRKASSRDVRVRRHLMSQSRSVGSSADCTWHIRGGHRLRSGTETRMRRAQQGPLGAVSSAVFRAIGRGPLWGRHAVREGAPEAECPRVPAAVAEALPAEASRSRVLPFLPVLCSKAGRNAGRLGHLRDSSLTRSTGLAGPGTAVWGCGGPRGSVLSVWEAPWGHLTTQPGGHRVAAGAGRTRAGGVSGRRPWPSAQRGR